ncbi:hypothetical protein HMPREF9555_00934 [Selenomonas artemidis F0399]|uniref:Uncharacterized protein n=1 Tax=Selenomonas artemidis F0399 TaxID=749551 RepID=E7N1S5_9FIRM|nr:hypothetical protein HMPREF9555_00934 [Selenomonas artemidis F0399]
MMNSAIGERQMLPWQTNSIFFITYDLPVRCGFGSGTADSTVNLSAPQAPRACLLHMKMLEYKWNDKLGEI